MDPRHLYQLAVVLEKGSITAASKHLLLTQPTLTRNMHTLEMQAGGPLFARSRFGVRSTALGDSLAREGRAIGRSLWGAREIVARHRLGLRNELRLGVGPLLALAAMPGLTERLLESGTTTPLTIRSDSPDRVLDALIDGELDVAVTPAEAGARSARNIVRYPLVEDEIGVFCGQRHVLASRSRIEPGDVDDRDWISLGIVSRFERTVRELQDAAGAHRVRTHLATSGDAVMVLSTLRLGRHLAVLPRLLTRLISEQYELVELPIAAARSRRDIYLWCRDTLVGDPGFERFRQLASDYFAALRSDAPGRGRRRGRADTVVP